MGVLGGIAVLLLDAVVTYFFTTLAGVVQFLFHAVAAWFLSFSSAASKPPRLHRSRRAAGKA